MDLLIGSRHFNSVHGSKTFIAVGTIFGTDEAIAGYRSTVRHMVTGMMLPDMETLYA